MKTVTKCTARTQLRQAGNNPVQMRVRKQKKTKKKQEEGRKAIKNTDWNKNEARFDKLSSLNKVARLPVSQVTMSCYHSFVGNISPISQREGNSLYWLNSACRSQVQERGDP